MVTNNVRFGNVYETLGKDWFVAVIDRFYDKVETDDLLRRLYPQDLTESRDHMVKFLIQFWGGPTTYSDERGHPRLRMRHMPFEIGQAERDAWMKHMREAVQEGNLQAELEQQMLDYFERAATHTINTAS